MFNPSPYNKAILEFWQNNPEQNIAVDAVAGSGKTSQIAYLCQNAPQAKKLYLVFSKEMQTEVEPRLAKFNVDVKTIHSFGRQAIVLKGYRARIDQWKYQNLLDQYEYDQDKFGISKNQFVKILEIVRDWYEPISNESILDAMEHWDISASDEFYELLTEFCQYMQFINETGASDLNVISFNDMVYLPLYHNLQFPRYEECFVDEAQDLNRSKMLVVKKLQGRVTIVGDPHQAIFGFSGADTRAFQRMIDELDCEVFSLPVCYRCPDSVIELAQEYVPHIKGVGKEGEVLKQSYQQMLDTLAPDDMVICRTNAPLVSLALKLLVAGKPAKIKGRQFAEGVIRLIEEVEKKKISYSNLDRELDILIDSKVERTKSDGKIQNLYDSGDCIKAIAEECDNYYQLKAKIRSLFDDKEDKDFISLSSFHRSKGLERDNVTILLQKLTPPGCDQESNLVYVAMTRAKKSLTFVKI